MDSFKIKQPYGFTLNSTLAVLCLGLLIVSYISDKVVPKSYKLIDMQVIFTVSQLKDSLKLNRFPGPKLARFSNLWALVQSRYIPQIDPNRENSFIDTITENT